MQHDETSRLEPLDVLATRRVTSEIHVDRRAQAHGCDNRVEAVPVDEGGNALTGQVLVDVRLNNGSLRVE